jgi:hypothetical protein
MDYGDALSPEVYWGERDMFLDVLVSNFACRDARGGLVIINTAFLDESGLSSGRESPPAATGGQSGRFRPCWLRVTYFPQSG